MRQLFAHATFKSGISVQTYYSNGETGKLGFIAYDESYFICTKYS